MGLASIFNIPDTPEARLVWSFNHMAHHRDIIRRIYETRRLATPEYAIDPININDMAVWGYQHQQMHNNMNAVLGINGNDLVDVNWKDPGELSEWIQLNGSEHYQAGNILGV